MNKVGAWLVLGACVSGLGAVAACDVDDNTVLPTDGGTDSTFSPPDASPDASDGSLPRDFTADEEAVLKTLGPLAAKPPADPTNKYAEDPKAATLGQMLFFDKSYSGPIVLGDDGANGGLGAAGATGKVSCASCHVSSAVKMEGVLPCSEQAS